MLRIQTLGRFRIEYRHGVSFRSKREQAVLAYLGVRLGQSVPRTRLASAMWPETDEVQARYNLRRSLSNIRAALGAGFHGLLADQDTCCLVADDVSCDAHEILIGRPSAWSLYQAPFMEGLDEPWAVADRRRIEAAVATAMLDRAKSESSAKSSELYSRILELDPVREDLTTIALQGLAEAGDRAAVIEGYRSHRRAVRAMYGTDPSSAVKELVRAAVGERQALGPPPDTRERGFPTFLTSFLGRDKEVVALRQAVVQSRVVTVLGPGGAGKTRLAVEAISKRRKGMRAVFVPLAAVPRGTDVLDAIAGAIGSNEGDGSTLEACLYLLRTDPAVLVLDNCEHLADEVGRTVGVLLEGAPESRFVLTSRSALRIAGERLMPVGALRQRAVQLFKERVASLAPETNLRGEAVRMAQICERLDRLPLAIELAAARLRSMTLADLAARIEEGTEVLKSWEPAPVQHESLASSIDWSVSLLDTPERTALARACLFPAGFTLASAEAVLPDTPEERGRVLDLVTGLVDHSLLTFDATTGRFGTLFIVRSRVLETLDRQIGDAARGRLVEWWSEHASQMAKGGVGGQLDRIAESYQVEFPNVRAAVEWLFQDSLRIEQWRELWRLFGLYCLRTSQLVVGEAMFATAHRVADGQAETSTQAMLAASWSSLLIDLGRSDEAVAALEPIMERLGDLADATLRARVEANMSLATLNIGHRERAVELARDSEARAVEAGAFAVAAVASKVLAIAYTELGDYREAHASIRRSLDAAVKQGDPWREMHARLAEVEILAAAGRFGEALAELPGVIGACRERDYKFSVVSSLVVAVRILAGLGETAAAEACLRPCLDANAVFGPSRLEVVRLTLSDELDDLQGKLEAAIACTGQVEPAKDPVSSVVTQLELAMERRSRSLAR